VRNLILSVCLLLLVFSLSASAADELVVGTTEWWPWQILKGGTFSGITADILKELSERTGFAMVIRQFPQKRMMHAFKMQQIDMEPTVSPAWRDMQKEISVYTIPFYTTGDIILVRRGSGIRGKSARDFKGLTLGCGLGYFYPEGFQEAFDNGEIFRDDNPHSEKNIKKLASNWIDGAIIDRTQAMYVLKKYNLNPPDFEVAYEFQPTKLCMRLHTSRQDLLPVLNAALEGMKTDGTIETIVGRYTGDPHQDEIPPLPSPN